MSQDSRIRRNVLIFVIGVWGLAAAGGLLNTTFHTDAGSLVFAVSPILMAVLLRSLAGDGWSDAGLALRWKASWRWYVFSLLAYPVTIAVVMLLGMALGLTTLHGEVGGLAPALLAGMAGQLIPRVLFAIFEEWGWRGYLEPRLAALRVSDLPRHLLVGVVWGIWHLPLILPGGYTDLPYAVFLPMFFIGVMIASIVYGQMRKAGGTVWTSVLMHGAGNTVAWAILLSNAATFQNKVLAYLAPESVLTILLWGPLAWWMASRHPGQALLKQGV